MKSFLHRQYLLWDTVQPRFLAVNVAHQGLIFLTFAGALFIPLMFKLHDTPLSSPEAGTIGYQFTVLHESIWPAFPIVFVMIFLHSVFFSHRIVGPLYRFRSVFKSISQGDLTVTTDIRERDYLYPEAGTLGEMIRELRSKLTRIESDCQAIMDLIGELKSGMPAESSKTAQELLTKLEQQATHLKTDLSQFRLRPAASNR